MEKGLRSRCLLEINYEIPSIIFLPWRQPRNILCRSIFQYVGQIVVHLDQMSKPRQIKQQQKKSSVKLFNTLFILYIKRSYFT